MGVVMLVKLGTRGDGTRQGRERPTRRFQPRRSNCAPPLLSLQKSFGHSSSATLYKISTVEVPRPRSCTIELYERDDLRSGARRASALVLHLTPGKSKKRVKDPDTRAAFPIQRHMYCSAAGQLPSACETQVSPREEKRGEAETDPAAGMLQCHSVLFVLSRVPLSAPFTSPATRRDSAAKLPLSTLQRAIASPALGRRSFDQPSYSSQNDSRSTPS